MTDKKIPLGRGRGSLLDIMKQREQERKREREYEGHSLETPSQSSSDQTRSFEGHFHQSSSDQTRSFERHFHQSSLDQTRSLVEQPQSSFEAQIPIAVNKGRGRANLANLMKLRESELESEQIRTVGRSRSVGRGTLMGLLPRHR